ncbi:hypothetical protein Dda_5911 [Drechslerella dactyloides]|uniref:Uncharacterized protein n=1 Tax=Drechslerella dactyloides TaxID=74499 RepID=A0AAD6NI03_DREDA|nr:hypothetical protein Dda_5911 [Drechslerella dactyloides]
MPREQSVSISRIKMGCAASKQELGRRLKVGRRHDLQIGSPTNFKRSSLSYPSTLCIDCDLPSRALLDSLGNTDSSLCCSCGDADTLDFSLEVDFKPLSPITLSPITPNSSPPPLAFSPPPSLPPSPSPVAKMPALATQDGQDKDTIMGSPLQQLPPRKELPTAYNFDFGFLHPSKDDCVCLDPYVDEDADEEEDEPIQPTHKRCESFTSKTWTVDHKVVVTAKEVPACPGSASRSNSRSSSFASLRNGLRSAAAMLSRHPDPELFMEGSDGTHATATTGTSRQGMYIPKSRAWGGRHTTAFEMLNQSSPDLLSASATKSQRVSKDQVKMVRIRGSKSTNWL